MAGFFFFFQERRLILIIKAFPFLGPPLKNIPNDKCEPNRVKNDVNTKDWPTVASEQMLTVVTRRKRAYKTAFTALSAVTLFIFHPLPEFAFLFLFIYCNFLNMLITFWVTTPLSVFNQRFSFSILSNIRPMCHAFYMWYFIPVLLMGFNTLRA